MSGKEKREVIKISPIVFICVVFNLIFVAIIFFLLNRLPPIIPLYYGAPSGQAQLTGRNAIFIPTIITLSGILINIILSSRTKDSFLKVVFQWSSLFLTFLSFYTTVRILLLVGNFH